MTFTNPICVYYIPVRRAPTINLFNLSLKCQKSIINPFITVENDNYNKQAPI